MTSHLISNHLPGRGRRAAAVVSLFVIAALLAPCALPRLPVRDARREFTVWAFSDIQPRSEAEKRFFDRAVSDVRENGIRFDAAVVGGDIAQYPVNGVGPETWDWYGRELGNFPGKPFYEIAGNHDARNLPEYLERTGRPLHYAVRYGNLLLILLSDEDPSSGSDIPEPVFRWWERLVEENQGDIIVTVTHAPLRGSGFFWNFPFRRTIVDSERFAKVLERRRVDLWLFGHTHVASPLGTKTRTVPALGGTTFVNISAIREDYLLCDAESRFISFTPGSDRAILRTRNHEDRAFDEAADRVIRLGAPFIYDGAAPQLVAYGDGPGGAAVAGVLRLPAAAPPGEAAP